MYQTRFINNLINKVFPLGYKDDFCLLAKNAFPLVIHLYKFNILVKLFYFFSNNQIDNWQFKSSFYSKY